MTSSDFIKSVLLSGHDALTAFSEGRLTSSFGEVIESEKCLEFPVLGHWYTSVLLGTQDFRVTFKIHYSFPRILPWLSENQARSIEQGLSHSREFGAELSNWWAGRIKSQLLVSVNDLSFGLPVHSLGFDELFSRRSNGRDCYFGALKVLNENDAQSFLWMSVLLELKSLDALEKLSLPENDDSERSTSGGFELL